jgi:hypothetical protein
LLKKHGERKPQRRREPKEESAVRTEQQRNGTAERQRNREQSRKNLQGRFLERKETPSPKLRLGTSWRAFSAREW